ncbi:hypothetical protein G3M48_001779, partial [Beauveria asiatica]
RDDINGDGKADYVWTRPLDGQVQVWLNTYPQQPAWRHIGIVKDGVRGHSGRRQHTLREVHGDAAAAYG